MACMRLTVRGAVAMHLGEDQDDIERTRRYQPTRTPCAVYTVGNDYLTASPKGKKPRPSAEYEWDRIESKAVESCGWQIWRAA